MNPIIIDGEEFKLVPILSKGVSEEVYALKPVKKTEKQSYCLYFDLNLDDQDMQNGLVWRELDLTPTTANKLSEAISALVEYVTTGGDANNDRLVDLALEAARLFQESQ